MTALRSNRQTFETTEITRSYSNSKRHFTAPRAATEDSFPKFPSKPTSRGFPIGVSPSSASHSNDSNLQQSSVSVQYDDQSTTSPDIREYDVLLGRSKVAHGNPGNKRFRELIQAFRCEYQRAKVRQQKTSLVKKIIHMISGKGGRFLKYNEEMGWYQVDEQETYDKVSHALRSAREPINISALTEHVTWNLLQPSKAMGCVQPRFDELLRRQKRMMCDLVDQQSKNRSENANKVVEKDKMDLWPLEIEHPRCSLDGEMLNMLTYFFDL